MCICFAVYPFKAVYAYTPSKLPSSVSAHLKPQPTEEMDVSWEPVVKLSPNVSTAASDVKPVGNGSSDVKPVGNGSSDHVKIPTSVHPTSSVSNGDGIGTMVVYSRRTEGLNGSASLNEEGGGGGGGESMVGAAVQCVTRVLRRSCSLDGVALASRCYGDEELFCQHRGVGQSRNNSSDDDWHSQGETHHLSCCNLLPATQSRK